MISNEDIDSMMSSESSDDDVTKITKVETSNENSGGYKSDKINLDEKIPLKETSKLQVNFFNISSTCEQYFKVIRVYFNLGFGLVKSQVEIWLVAVPG